MNLYANTSTCINTTMATAAIQKTRHILPRNERCFHVFRPDFLLFIFFFAFMIAVAKVHKKATRDKIFLLIEKNCYFANILANLLDESICRWFSKNKVMNVNVFSCFYSESQFITKDCRYAQLYAMYVEVLDICKRFSKNLVNELDNVPRRGCGSQILRPD